MTAELFLVQRTSSNVLATIRLLQGKFVVGRSSQAEIIVPHHSVSRRHALLEISAAGVLVNDLKSRNGTFVNETRITHSPLALGQRVSFGAISFSLSDSPADGCELDSKQETCDPRRLRNALAETVEVRVELTPAQQRVCDLLLTGSLEKQVAAKLGLSTHTVHNHAREIYRAYGVHSRAELLLRVLPNSQSNANV